MTEEHARPLSEFLSTSEEEECVEELPKKRELTADERRYYEKRISCPEEGLKKACIRLKKMGWREAYRNNMVTLNRCREELGLPSVTDPEDA